MHAWSLPACAHDTLTVQEEGLEGLEATSSHRSARVVSGAKSKWVALQRTYLFGRRAAVSTSW